MKHSIPILLLLACSAFAEPNLTQGKVDSLILPFSLGQLVSMLEEQLEGIDRPLFIQRKWELIRAYYSYKAARQEIEYLTESRDIQQSLHSLNLKRQKQAAIEDEEVLRSRSALIEKEIALLQRIESCRSDYLTILQLCNVEIRDEKTRQASENPFSPGK